MGAGKHLPSKPRDLEMVRHILEAWDLLFVVTMDFLVNLTDVLKQSRRT